MAKKKEEKPTANLQIKAVNLLEVDYKAPSQEKLANYHYSIKLESRIDREQQYVTMDVYVEIKSEDQKERLGSIGVGCTYYTSWRINP